MPSLLLTSVLQLLGIGVIIAEFFVPSGGMLSVLSAGLIGYSLYLAYTQVSIGAGYLFTGADVVLIPIIVLMGIRMVGRSKASLHAQLSSASGVVSQAADLSLLTGKEGVTVSLLRPSGIAQIEGHRVDVVTGGEFLGKSTLVMVVAVTGNQVIVRKKEKDRLDAETLESRPPQT